MTKKRIFISIPLSKEIKEEFCKLKEELKEFPIKWVKEENIHFTLEFIGRVGEEKLETLLSVVDKVANLFSPFQLKFDEISYQPREKIKAQMIWARIEKTKEIVELKKKLRELLKKNGFSLELEREFLPHITLGKIKSWQWRRIDIDQLPEIFNFFNFKEEVFFISVIESILKIKGPEHKIIKHFNFKEHQKKREVDKASEKEIK